MKALFSYLFICLSISVFAQKTSFPKGETIDSLKVDESSKESYALYLPKSYDPTKLSPVVFIFEPVARGKIGISPFIKASEKYGYILVCSNDSRNGPYERNFEIANNLFSKIFSDFSIDQKRIYASGFSGGARLATTIAVLSGQIQGVVACGAAFSFNKGHLPHKDIFSFAGIIGDEDMNFKEMHNARGFLNRLKVPNELFVYEINHKWPDPDQMLAAFDWLHLEAIRKGILPEDQENIKDIYSAYYNKAIDLEKRNRLLDSSNELERITRAFGRYIRLDSINTKLTNLKNSKAYKKEKKSLEANFKEEVVLSDKFMERFNKDFKKKNRPNMKWWTSEIKKLRNNIESSEGSKKKMLQRVQYKIFALAIESATLGNKIEHINQSIFCYDVCILIYPKYRFPYFKQMENFINKNDETAALEYLEKLLNNGYDNLQRIRGYKPFNSLLSNEKFKQLTKIN